MAEKEYYKAIKDAFEQKFRQKIDNVHLEITSEGKFSPQLKSEIPRAVSYTHLTLPTIYSV